jgi:CheY-like chemotaxis protein
VEQKETILSADDDENDVLLLKMAFAKVGLAEKLQQVKDGAEAIHYLNGDGVYADRESFPFPCLLLLDLKMPYKNGFDVLTWIRAQPVIKHLIVAVLTASRDDADIRRAYDLCTNSYLVKPTTVAGLENLARKVKDYWLELNSNPDCRPLARRSADFNPQNGYERD